MSVNETKTLPRGFENGYAAGDVRYRQGEQKNGPPMVSFRGPRRGPAGMAQPVEKAHNTKKTLLRLLAYFKHAKRLLILLMCAVVMVTLASQWCCSQILLARTIGSST